MTRHEAITILGELPADIGDGLEALREDLRALGSQMRQDPELRTLHDTERVHFMSFFIVDPEPDVGPGYVALEVNWDGAAGDLYEHLARKAQGVLGRLFSRCRNYPREGGVRDLERFLRAHNRGADAYYLGTPDRSVQQIKTERELRKKAAAKLEEIGWRNTAGHTFRELQRRLPESAGPPPTRSLRVRWSLRRGGFAKMAGASARAGRWVLVFVLGITGLIDLAVRVSLELGAPRPDESSVASLIAWLRAHPLGALIVALAPSAYALLFVFPWWRETPRQLAGKGTRILLGVLRRKLQSWAWRTTLIVGLVGVCPRLFGILHPLIADALTLLGGVLVVVAVGGLTLATFGRVLASLLTPLAAAGWAYLLVHAPQAPVFASEVETIAMAVLSVGVGGLFALATLAVAFAVIHVAWGATAGWLATPVLAMLWVLLFLSNWESPLRLLLYWSVVLLAFLLLAAVEAALFMLAIRRAEEREGNQEASWDLEHLDEVQRHEDHVYQNHLVNVSTIKGKPGTAAHRLRVATLRGVLRAVALAAWVMFNRGDLGGIKSIHFARFLILPDQRRLLFLSNYDDAFGSYLGDFTNVVGVTAVWGNTVSFPRPLFLLWGGIRDEQRFKAFGRRIQRETLGWYSAYHDLSVQDVDGATALRVSLSREVSTAPVGSQPTRIWGGDPMSEAECDEALRSV